VAHACPECGLEHEAMTASEPEPVIVDSGPNEHSVEIAKIEAKTSLAREEHYTEQERLRLDAEMAALQAENEALRAAAPPVVVVDTSEPEPEPELDIEEEPSEEEPPENPGPAAEPVKDGKKKRSGWWDGYAKG
jgi:hypothetical protein